MLPTVTIDGRLVADPELRFTQGGKAVCSLRVAASDSKKTDTGWETTEQIFIGVSLWDNEAEAAANALQKGDQVVVTGRIFEREYDKNDGTKGKSLEVKYPTVAKKVSAPKVQRSTPSAAPANDPWATAPAGNDKPPF